MESKATTIAKNLALAMVFTAGVYGGSWVLENSFLHVYFLWIQTVGLQVVLFALTLALLASMFTLAVAAIGSVITMVKAIFRRKKNDDE